MGTTCFFRAATLLETRVQTFTLRTIYPLSLVTGSTTAVTTVPITTAIVVIVITTAVGLVVGRCTSPGASCFHARVQAGTGTAVYELSFVSGDPTAVTIVPIAPAVVVVVIAPTITDIT